MSRMKIVGTNQPAELTIEGRTIRIHIESFELETKIEDAVAFNDLTEAISTSEHLYIRATVLKS